MNVMQMLDLMDVYSSYLYACNSTQMLICVKWGEHPHDVQPVPAPARGYRPWKPENGSYIVIQYSR